MSNLHLKSRGLRRRIKLRSALLTAVAVVLVGTGLFLIFRSQQPAYGGKNLNDWLDRLQAKGEEDQEAVLAVRQIGTNAIPFLVKMMRSEDSSLKRHLIGMLRMQRLVKINIVDDQERHLRAEIGFAVLGPIAGSAVPELEPLIWKSSITRSAVGALVSTGNEGLRVATTALRSTNAFVRRETTGRLGAIGIVRFSTNCTPEQLQILRSQAEIAVPPLIAVCADPDELVRARAAIALGLLGQKPDQAIPVLEKLLREESGWRVPAAAAKSLGRFGTNAVTAIPALKQAVEHKDSRVSGSARDALQAIDAAAAGVGAKEDPE